MNEIKIIIMKNNLCVPKNITVVAHAQSYLPHVHSEVAYVYMVSIISPVSSDQCVCVCV